MRFTFSTLTASLLVASTVRAAPLYTRCDDKDNPNVQVGGTVPPGGEPIDFDDAEAVKGRVKFLWSEIEKYRPVEHAMCETEYRDFGPKMYEMLETSLNERPFQVDFYRTTHDNVSLGKDFLWGYASAAAQIEGAVKADGRGPTAWDWFAHRTDLIPDNSTFDVVTNFRWIYPLDVKRIAQMGAKLYSISISWSRVMPLGRGYVSEEGLQFYKDLVKEIHNNGMKAAVTLQHFDIPLYLQLSENGLQNESYADAFAGYADVILRALAPLNVEYWVSHNEPNIHCNMLYPSTLQGLYGYKQAPPATPYQCSGNSIRAHGRFNELFRKYQREGIISKDAKISYKNAGTVDVPWNATSEADNAAIERIIEFDLAFYADPIHGRNGSHDYPEVIKREVPKEWLPELTEEDQRRLENSADTFMTDYYSSHIKKALSTEEAKLCYGNVSHPSWPYCSTGMKTMSDGWPLAAEYPDKTEQFMPSTPGAFRRHLKYIHERWPTQEGIVVAEFGWAERDEAEKTDMSELVIDSGRMSYYRDHFNQIVQSMHTDGVKFLGAWAWSATSNMEWNAGKIPRYGVQSVNYSDPSLPRTYLASSYLIKDFFQKHVPQS